MVSLNALAEFLRLQDPNKDWAAALAGFSQIGGGERMTGEAPIVPPPETNVQPTVHPPTSIPTSSTISPEKISPSTTSPSESSKPSPTRQQIDPMDVDPLSAYYDSDPSEGEGKASEEQKSKEEEDESERTPVAETVPQESEREEIDLNEMARKQGLMSDEEFEALLKEVTRMEDVTATMADGLDLASEAVREGGEASTKNDPEGLAHRPEDEVEKRQTREKELKSVTPQPKVGESEAEETVVRTEEPEPVAPLVLKPKAVRPKPKRVSQRCLGKWTSSKAKANTEADAVEVSSEEEGTTPTKPGEESLSATNCEDTSTATEAVNPTPSDQGEETDQMAEGPDLASESVGHDEPRDDNTHIRVETQSTAREDLSAPVEENLEKNDDGDEDRYREERKRKGKAPVKRKPTSKKQRTGNIGIVITDPDQRTTPHRQETNDSDYTASEESGSDSVTTAQPQTRRS